LMSGWDGLKAGTPIVGFYWTLPMPKVGFRALPADAAEAAGVSRTIRYQRQRIREFVAENRANLVGEFVFFELSPDRGTEHVRGVADACLKRCRETSARLLYIDFAFVDGWRFHPYLNRLMLEAPVSCLGLPPDPMMMDGALFDPIAHFRQRREEMRGCNGADERWPAIRQALEAELAAEGHTGRWERVAAALNSRGITSVTGKAWTPENVKQAARKLEIMPK
jgi:hypothetical protein